jgi:RimJ/RimL family protein N-acetyltransferase
MPNSGSNIDPSGLIIDGRHVRLEPLGPRHLQGLVAAASVEPSLYRWSPVPQGGRAVAAYIDTGLACQAAGTALPFAIVRRSDEVIIGSTRFFNLEHWPWPSGHPLHDRAEPDACEIGYTWLTLSAIRTAANTESKLLLLTFAFEEWKVQRVCFHADARNERSRAAIERLGASFEGILRAHRLAVDLIPRDSARFSIVGSEWPAVRRRLQDRLAQRD